MALLNLRGLFERVPPKVHPVVVRAPTRQVLAVGFGLFIGHALPPRPSTIVRPLVVQGATSHRSIVWPEVDISRRTSTSPQSLPVIVLDTILRRTVSPVRPIIGGRGGTRTPLAIRPVVITGSPRPRPPQNILVGTAVATETEDVELRFVRPVVVSIQPLRRSSWSGLIGTAVSTEIEDVEPRFVRPIVVPLSTRVSIRWTGLVGHRVQLLPTTRVRPLVVLPSSRVTSRWTGLVGTAAATETEDIEPRFVRPLVISPSSRVTSRWTGLVGKPLVSTQIVVVSPHFVLPLVVLPPARANSRWAGLIGRNIHLPTSSFPTQYSGLRVFYDGQIRDLCLVALADAPHMGGRLVVKKEGVEYAIYLVETTDQYASAVRVETALGTKAIRLKT